MIPLVDMVPEISTSRIEHTNILYCLERGGRDWIADQKRVEISNLEIVGKMVEVKSEKNVTEVLLNTKFQLKWAENL